MTLEHYFLDGTKIEANANKYKWVWAKSTAKYKERLQEKIQELLEKIEQENEAEQEAYGDSMVTAPRSGNMSVVSAPPVPSNRSARGRLATVGSGYYIVVSRHI